MKFEEILPLIRQGKKARVKECRNGEYWKAGFQIIESPCELHHWCPKFTIICCDKNGEIIINKRSWGISRHLIMDEDWEIIDCSESETD